MKIIPINSPKHGIKECLVDDEDYDWITKDYFLNLFKHTSGKFYARCKLKRDYKSLQGQLHRMVYSRYNTLPSDVAIDHIDRDPLNNQKSNLRMATQAQNCANQSKNRKSLSKYKGVAKNRDRWCALIQKNKKRTYIGSFSTEIEAAVAYDIVAKHIFSEFAVLNFSNPDTHLYDKVYKMVDRCRSGSSQSRISTFN